ncbi:MAG: MaoC family dehydratase N-terminal domain-containing protein [Hyphomicrobiales bacterium]|nr:MaoC family dehydratase N-terminal domain-containing protein [Hyphomicrobiales bacterium]
MTTEIKASPAEAPADVATMKNVTFDEIEVGQSASSVHPIGEAEIKLFAAVSGDVNPAHLDAAWAATTPFAGVIAHGMLSAGFISALLGTTLPGPGTIYLDQSLRFRRPVRPGDVLTATVTVSAKDDAKKRVTLDCACTNQNGEAVVTGVATVLAPSEKIERTRPARPAVTLG